MYASGKKTLGQFDVTDDWGLDLTLDFPEYDDSFEDFPEIDLSIDDVEPNNVPEGQSAAAAGSEPVVTGGTPAVPQKAGFPTGLLVVAGLAAYLLMKR